MLVDERFLQEAQTLLSLDERGQEEMLLALRLETLHEMRQADDDPRRTRQTHARTHAPARHCTHNPACLKVRSVAASFRSSCSTTPCFMTRWSD